MERQNFTLRHFLVTIKQLRYNAAKKGGRQVAFLVGCIIGSFSHVVGIRLPQQQNWWSARSACPHCKQVLRAYELIPIVSYILQRGRCRLCNERISLRYIIIELFAGVWSALFFAQYGMTYDWLVHVLLLLFCCIIIVSDWLYMVVPNRVLLYVGVPLCVLASAGQSLYSMIGGAVVGFLLLYTIYRLTEGIGAGDVKLMLILGAIVQLQKLFFMLFIACMIGMLLCFVQRKRIIPFAPALCFATLLTLYIDALQFITIGREL